MIPAYTRTECRYLMKDDEYFEISVMESLRIIAWSVVITLGVAFSLFIFIL